MHIEDEKSRAFHDAVVKQRWHSEELEHTSEGNLAQACFDAGYKLALGAPATPAPLADAELTELMALLDKASGTWSKWREADLGTSDGQRLRAKNAMVAAMYALLPTAEHLLPALLARLAAAETKATAYQALINDMLNSTATSEGAARWLSGGMAKIEGGQPHA